MLSCLTTEGSDAKGSIVVAAWHHYQHTRVSNAGAASTRVGHELGSGKPKRAQLAAVTVIGLEIILMLLVVVVGIAARDLWGYLFTSDPEVRLVELRKIAVRLITHSSHYLHIGQCHAAHGMR